MAKTKLFECCVMSFVQSKMLSAQLVSQLIPIVEEHGAEVLEPDADGKIPMPEPTHIVSNTIEFEQYNEAQAIMIPVVKVAWITNSVARMKQAQVRPYSPDPRMIFSNVILTCADIPIMDKESIIGATTSLGGMASKDLAKMTTHICALTVDHPKCQFALEKFPKCKIVLPHWFVDCFALGKKIDETPYLLPNPEIHLSDSDAEISVRQTGQLDGATSAVPNSLLGNGLELSARDKLVVFAQKKVMLAPDLPAGGRLRKALGDLIIGGGGEVVNKVDDCNMFVCHYRQGLDYVRAAQQGKDVGNLAWIYHLIVQNEWTDPHHRLLHYPLPSHGIPGFKDMKIALSNYGGDTRNYLENLIEASGATYTKTMKAENTHLITARMHSEKVEAAKEWNIPIINHLWIEESYAKCTVQSLTIPKYTHFPRRTNLGEVIGQTFFDEPKLHAMFYPGGDDNLVSRRNRRIRNAAQENHPFTGVEEPDLTFLEDDGPIPEPKKAKAPRTTQKAEAFVTPKTRHVRVSKENDTPLVVSSASRSAKAQALTKLHDLAPDVALYEKEKKRGAKDGNGPWGGKRAANLIDKDKKRKSSSPADEQTDEEQEAKHPSKKTKSSLPPVGMKICLTGYKRWVGERQREEADRKKLRQLGILIQTDSSANCNYLAAPSMVRTMKFLCALAKGPEVINSSFIDACLEQGKLPGVEDHLLTDKKSEAHFGVTVKQAVARARQNRGRLLYHVPVYCTVDIKNGTESYKAIAEANGAIFSLYSARGGTKIKPTTAEEDGGVAPDPVYLLTSQSPTEKKLWPLFEEMAHKGHMEPRVVVSDWLLDVAMKQQIVFNKKYLAAEYFKVFANK